MSDEVFDTGIGTMSSRGRTYLVLTILPHCLARYPERHKGCSYVPPELDERFSLFSKLQPKEHPVKALIASRSDLTT
jgi:hypothetical protein